MEDGTTPAYAEETAQDLIMFVGNRWCFTIFFFSPPHLNFLRMARGKGKRGMVCCSRWVSGDVGETATLS